MQSQLNQFVTSKHAVRFNPNRPKIVNTHGKYSVKRCKATIVHGQITQASNFLNLNIKWAGRGLMVG